MKALFYFKVFSLAFALMPLVAGAAWPSVWPTGFWGTQGGGLVTCGGAGGNACDSLCDIYDTLGNLVAFVLSLLFFAVAPAMLVWGGVTILTAGANPGQFEHGKKVITGTVIAVVIGLLSYTIVREGMGWVVTSSALSDAFSCQEPVTTP